MTKLVSLDDTTLECLPCCGVKNRRHTGRNEKNCWIGKQSARGLRAHVLLTGDNRQCGYIEYLPAEHAWRGVRAPGYMFIHCLWTFYRSIQNCGEAGRMIDRCVEDARGAGMDGVAVLAREGPWLAGPAVFLKYGFGVAATAPPDYTLLALKFRAGAPDPEFRPNRKKKYGPGVTIIRSPQCPHIAKFAGEIEIAAREQYGLSVRTVEITTAAQAQNAPTPYGVFAILYNDRIIADHQISRRRFSNIMREELKRPRLA